jgi:hypothetical protein
MVVRTTLSNINGLYQVQILPFRPTFSSNWIFRKISPDRLQPQFRLVFELKSSINLMAEGGGRGDGSSLDAAAARYIFRAEVARIP